MYTIVETRSASLDTLAVTIQALHVSGKQMTMAVFRQLPQKYEQAGSQLWGTVRYSIKDEGDIWLVFSHEGVLYRRYVRTTKRYAFAGNDLQALRRSVEMRRTLDHNKERLVEEEKRLAEMEQLLKEEKDLYDHEWVVDKNILESLPQLFIAV